MDKQALRDNLKDIVLKFDCRTAWWAFAEEMKAGGYNNPDIARTIDFAKSHFSYGKVDCLDKAISIYVDDVVGKIALTPSPRRYFEDVLLPKLVLQVLAE